MMPNGKIIALFLCQRHRQPMIPVEHAVAISGVGLEGDLHALKYDTRQVLLMDVETLNILELTPGIVKENITLEGIDLSSMDTGCVVRIGEEVTMEVTAPCTPCSRMDEIRPGLQRTIRGKRGMLCRVLTGGTLNVGDPVKVEQPLASLST